MAGKIKYQLSTKNDMRRAIAAYTNGDCRLNEACRRYGIPKPTLKRYVGEKNAFANNDIKFAGRPRIFSNDIEEELENHIFCSYTQIFGLTSSRTSENWRFRLPKGMAYRIHSTSQREWPEKSGTTSLWLDIRI